MNQHATTFQKKSLSCQDQSASSVAEWPVFAIASVFSIAILILACKTPPPASTPTDGIACIASIANTLTGTEDPNLISGACGRTIDDLISWLVSNIAPAKPGEALSPLQARYGRILQKARAGTPSGIKELVK